MYLLSNKPDLCVQQIAIGTTLKWWYRTIAWLQPTCNSAVKVLLLMHSNRVIDRCLNYSNI